MRVCGLVALLAACSDKSETPTSGPSAAAQPSTTAPSQDATVAELLAGSDSQQPAAPDQSSPSPKGSSTESTVATSTGTPESADEYARVVSVTPVTGPRQVCTNETVTEQRKPNDQHQVAGTVIGAIAGGVIGNQFGGGRGKTLATVGGAVGGGVVGKEVQRNHQSNDTVTQRGQALSMVERRRGCSGI